MSTPSSPYVKTFLFPWEVKKETKESIPGDLEDDKHESVDEEDLDDDNISCLSDGTAKPFTEYSGKEEDNIMNTNNDDMDLIKEEDDEEDDDGEYDDEEEDDKGIDILESELEIAMASRDEEALLSLLEITNHLIASSPAKKKKTPKKERYSSTTPEKVSKLTFENFHQENTRSPTYLSLSKKFESILKHSYYASSNQETGNDNNDPACMKTIGGLLDAVEVPTSSASVTVNEFDLKERLNFTEVANDTMDNIENEENRNSEHGDDYYCDLSSEFDGNSVVFLTDDKDGEEEAHDRKDANCDDDYEQTGNYVQPRDEFQENIVVQNEFDQVHESQDNLKSESREEVSVIEVVHLDAPLEVDGQLQGGVTADAMNSTNQMNTDVSNTMIQETSLSLDKKVEGKKSMMEDDANKENICQINNKVTSAEFLVTPIRRKKKPPPRSSLRKMKEAAMMLTNHNDNQGDEDSSSNDTPTTVKPISASPVSSNVEEERTSPLENTITTPSSSSSSSIVASLNAEIEMMMTSSNSDVVEETPIRNEVQNNDDETNDQEEVEGNKNNYSPDCIAGFDDINSENQKSDISTKFSSPSEEEMTPSKYNDLDSWIDDMMKHSKPTTSSNKSQKTSNKNLFNEMNKERRGFFISKEDVTKQAKTMIPLIMKQHEENERRIEEAARKMVPLILKEQQEIQKRERNRKIRERFARPIVRLTNEFYNDVIDNDDVSVHSIIKSATVKQIGAVETI